MRIDKMVKEVFPNASDAEIEHIVFERTGYPCFWNFEPEDEKNPEKCFRRQLLEYKDALKLGIRLCEFCNNPAEENGYTCHECKVVLDGAAFNNLS